MDGIEYGMKRVLMGRVPQGGDLLEFLTQLCREKNLSLGVVWALGAVTQANIGFYDQVEKRYCEVVFDRELELTACQGNISLKDGLPFVHLHANFGDRDGSTWSGHVMAGTNIFACEYTIIELTGEPLIRGLDPSTGLFLWRP
ncbi:MAG: DNA-binding protein [Deltaproteobacteria bacterium]|nr:DNA-binding protein [Deltaproteobacteria bacterium]